jgi:hypothetical protein
MWGVMRPLRGLMRDLVKEVIQKMTLVGLVVIP